MKSATRFETTAFFNAMRTGTREIVDQLNCHWFQAEIMYFFEQNIVEKKETVNGYIGNGKKIHRLHVTKYCQNGVEYMGNATSWCGSAKWSGGGRSQLFLTNEPAVTCEKCGVNH